MVARLFRLRVALLLSVFRGGFRAVARSVFIGLISVLAAVGLAWLPLWLSRGAEDRVAIDVILSSVLLVLVALVPFFANLGSLEPRQFGSYPATPASIATGLFLSSLLSWPTIWLLVWMAALVVLRPEWAGAPLAVIIAGVLTLVLAIAFARVSSALVRLVVPAKATSVLRWTGLLLLLAALPVMIFLLADALRSPRSQAIRDAAGVFGWTPFGATASGLSGAVHGEWTTAAAHFGIAAAAFLVLLLCWYLLVARSLTSVERPVSAGVTRDGLEIFERFPAKPRDVIAARALTYWRRDPRYRIALFAIPVAPVIMMAALWIAGMELHVLALLPLPVILLLFGWSVHNDVALDSTAIWTHVASGTKGIHDRAGRLAPVLLIGLPLAVVGSSITVTISGDWRLLPAVLGMNLAVLLVAAGVSSVFSAMMPYPATRPGDSPFAQPAVQGSGAGLAQTLSMLFALLFSLPPVVLSVYAIVDPTLGLNLVALGLGVAWGLLILGAGILIGGKIFDRGAPELIAVTQTFD